MMLLGLVRRLWRSVNKRSQVVASRANAALVKARRGADKVRSASGRRSAEYAWASYRHGQAALAAGEQVEAVRAFEIASRVFPSLHFLKTYVDLCAQLRLEPRADDSYREYVESCRGFFGDADPRYALALCERAEYFYVARRYDEAFQETLRSIEIYTNSGYPDCGRAFALQLAIMAATGKPPNALAHALLSMREALFVRVVVAIRERLTRPQSEVERRTLQAMMDIACEQSSAATGTG